MTYKDISICVKLGPWLM